MEVMIEVDDDGYITHVYVIVDDEADVEQLRVVLNNCVTDDSSDIMMDDESSSKCEGILRYIKNATVKSRSMDEISEGNNLRAAVIFTLVPLVMSFILCL